MTRFLGLTLITVVSTVTGQLLLKVGVGRVGPMPSAAGAIPGFLLSALLEWRVFLALVLAFVGALAWISAVSLVELTFAYPFMSLTFVIVQILGVALLREPWNWYRAAGVALIMLGIFVASRGL